MPRLFLLLVCLVAASASPVFAQQVNLSVPVRIAYFSPSRVFAESSDGKAATARLNALETERAKGAGQERGHRKDGADAAARSGCVSETARDLRTKELERFRLDTQRFIEDAQAELMGVRRDAESAFLVKLRPAVERVVKDNAIQLLFNFDSGVLAWGEPSLDVTNQIVKLIEAEQAQPKK